MIAAHNATIYNKYKDRHGRERFQRTVLRGVHVETTTALSYSSRSVRPDDRVVVIVPLRAEASRETYRAPLEWRKQRNKRKAWTIAAGDLIVPGDSSPDIKDSPSELDGQAEVYIVTGRDYYDFPSALAHWEVTAR